MPVGLASCNKGRQTRRATNRLSSMTVARLLHQERYLLRGWLGSRVAQTNTMVSAVRQRDRACRLALVTYSDP